jgi:hypothetical protein
LSGGKFWLRPAFGLGLHEPPKSLLKLRLPQNWAAPQDGADANADR